MQRSSWSSAHTALLAPALALALAMTVVTPTTVAVAQDAGSTITIVKDDELPSNAELAVRLSESTPLPDVRRVVISRDDDFADALASGVMQDTSPLLLVPRDGPVPDRVISEIRRVGADAAVILGGSSAVTPAVESQLADEGLTVQRRSGGSRFETAIAIAREEAGDATTAILARAFAADPANPTQGFADALAAGGMAAENNWPILLSDTTTLTPATRDYLTDSSIDRVLIVGGTAAISTMVEEEIRAMVGTTERIAGDSRAETAVEIAKERGVDSAADTGRIVLVDGSSPEGFAGGFAAAAHSALFDAPILLSDGLRLPPATETFLAPAAAAFAQTGAATTVTCVVHPLACDGGREALGLADLPLLSVDPPINSLVQPGQAVTLQLGPADEGRDRDVVVKGSCLGGTQELTTDDAGRATFALAGALNPYCSVEITYGSDDDAVAQGYSYTTVPGNEREPGISVSSEVFTYGAAVPSSPVYVNDTISCTGGSGGEAREDSAFEARVLQPDFHVQSFGLTSFPFAVTPGATCTARVEVPTGVARVLWGVYSWSDAGLRNPLLVGNGTTATFDFDQLDDGVTDVDVVWVLETNETDVGVPAPTGPGTSGQVFAPDGLTVRCDGVLLEEGLNFLQPGVPCTATSPTAGVQVLVVEPGRPLVPVDRAEFTPLPTQETVGVYAIITGAEALPTVGCDDAPEVGYAAVTPGVTTPSAPSTVHAFDGFQGEQLRMRADRVGASEIDPVLTLLDPSGEVVATNDDGDTGLNSRLDVTLQEEGRYCLQVEGFGGSTGDYLLTVDPAPAFVDSQTLDADQPQYFYDYSGLEGDLLVMELRPAGFEPTDPILELYDAQGNLVAADDDGGGYPSSRIVLTLPATGDYLVRATVYGESYGTYLFEASFPTAGTAFAASG